jgi:hypothetical protein
MVVLKVNLAYFSLERRRERERPVGELELGVAFRHLPPARTTAVNTRSHGIIVEGRTVTFGTSSWFVI